MSYSHTDAAYVEELAAALGQVGLAAWFDHDPRTGLVSGDRWNLVLRDRVDRCAALVVVMSPESMRSQWVHLEVGRASYRGHPVCPVLLAGEPFPHLAQLQYEDATAGGVAVSALLIGRLRSALTTPRPVRDHAGVIVGLGFPPPNPHFVGREHLLLEVEEDLYSGRSVAVAAMHGTGGVGKTQLAVEFAHRRRSDYDLIGWINSERPELIPAQVAALAPRLGVAAGPDADETARSVVKTLGNTGRFWLLVLDNAEEPDHLTPWLPRAGMGHVIVTSRQRGGWSHLGSIVDVDVLDRGEAVDLLRRSIPDIDGQVASGIAEQLGDLPLALEQAGGYLATELMPAVDYLRLLRTRGDDLLHRGRAPVGYEHTMATVWDLSRASLQAANPAGSQLLDLCAFLGPEPIPLTLFTTNIGLLPAPLAEAASDELAFADAVGALIARSLARRGDSEQGPTLAVHRLLAAAVRRPLPEADRDSVAATVLHLLHDYPTLQVEVGPRGWPMWRALLPHVLATTARPSTNVEDRHRAGVVLDSASLFLAATGQRAQALAASTDAVALLRSVTADDSTAHASDLASALNNLANRLADVGRPHDATLIALEAVSHYQRLVAPDDHRHLPSLTTAATNLGNRLAENGRHVQALTFSDMAVRLSRELVAHDRDAFLPELALALENHVARLAQNGRDLDALTTSVEALALYRELVAQDRAAYLQHLAGSLANHATQLSGAGQLDQALVASGEALTLRRELANIDRDAYRTDLAHSLGIHAVRLAESGQLTEAPTISEECVTIYSDLVAKGETVFLPDLASSLGNHALLVARCGRLIEALTHSDDAVALWRGLVAENRATHLPDLGRSLLNHATRLADVDRPDEALTTGAEAVKIRRELVALNAGANLPDLVAALSNHAVQLAELGNCDQAFSTSHEAVQICLTLVAEDRAHLPALTMSLSTFCWVRNKLRADVESSDIKHAISSAGLQADSILAGLAAARPDAFADQLRTVHNLIRQLSSD